MIYEFAHSRRRWFIAARTGDYAYWLNGFAVEGYSPGLRTLGLDGVE